MDNINKPIGTEESQQQNAADALKELLSAHEEQSPALDELLSPQDEALLERFFSQQRAEIQDHGFSRRVMRQLPSRNNKLNRWWTAFCIMLGIVFFIAIRGWKVLADAITVAVRTVPAQDVFQLTPVTLAVALGALALMFVLHRVEIEVR
ncbi:MAG: DUF5056 domain-containing protein [Prevotella sp.]|nr:DUF5056 domain-containing protein [Prevotella sp.]